MLRPYEELIEASDTYGNKRLVPRPPVAKTQISDEARVLINQVMLTPMYEYGEKGNGDKIVYKITDAKRGFSDLPPNDQDRVLAAMVKEGDLQPHEAQAVQNARTMRSTILPPEELAEQPADQDRIAA